MKRLANTRMPLNQVSASWGQKDENFLENTRRWIAHFANVIACLRHVPPQYWRKVKLNEKCNRKKEHK